MILEGLVTTADERGELHVAPMGPRVDGEHIRTLLLRPFQTSNTYRHLVRRGEGVFHVVDDVELIALAAIGQRPADWRATRAETVSGWILGGACRWYAFKVTDLIASEPRAEIRCEVVDRGRLKDFFGLNRAKHAVVEAAILATRVAFLPAAEIRAELERLRPLVDKTGGPIEHRAFERLSRFIDAACSPTSSSTDRVSETRLREAAGTAWRRDAS